jgi:putative hydrolase of the HAD superfamily
VREVLRRLDHPAPWRTLLDELYEAFRRAEVWQLYPDTAATLQQLAARGLKLAVISNWDRRLPEILDRLAIARFFDAVAVSSIEGVEKPAPEIFLRTLGQLEVAPAMAIHVGDSPRDDYLGAEAAGLTPVLLDRTRLHVDAGFRRIERLDELFGVL